MKNAPDQSFSLSLRVFSSWRGSSWGSADGFRDERGSGNLAGAAPCARETRTFWPVYFNNTAREVVPGAHKEMALKYSIILVPAGSLYPKPRDFFLGEILCSKRKKKGKSAIRKSSRGHPSAPPDQSCSYKGLASFIHNLQRCSISLS